MLRANVQLSPRLHGKRLHPATASATASFISWNTLAGSHEYGVASKFKVLSPCSWTVSYLFVLWLPCCICWSCHALTALSLFRNTSLGFYKYYNPYKLNCPLLFCLSLFSFHSKSNVMFLKRWYRYYAKVTYLSSNSMYTIIYLLISTQFHPHQKVCPPFCKHLFFFILCFCCIYFLRSIYFCFLSTIISSFKLQITSSSLPSFPLRLIRYFFPFISPPLFSTTLFSFKLLTT